MMSPRRPRRNLAGGNHSARRRRRVLPSGDHWARGLALRVAGRAPHPTEQAAGRGEIGNYGGDHLGGGRSYGRARVGARGHVGRSWWWQHAPREVRRTMTHAGAAGSGSGHGGAMACGTELSAPVAEAARGRAGQQEKRRTTEELTADSLSRPVGSGRC